MNIAFVTSEYITEKNFDGGLANYLYRVSTALVSRGHHIEIFTLSDKDDVIEREGIIIHRVRQEYLILRFLRLPFLSRLGRTARILWHSYILNHRLLKRHREIEFDIVQSASYRAVGLFTARQGIIPVVTRISSYEPLWHRFEGEPIDLDLCLSEFLEAKLRWYSRAVYAPSELLAQLITFFEPIDVDVIRPPFALEVTSLDDSVYRENLKTRYFLFYGTLCEKKGIRALTYAIRQLYETREEINFVFIGKQSEIDGLKAMDYIYRNIGGNAHRVKYLGVLRHEQLYPIVSNAHAVVLPSLIDNLPNTCLEAMGLGKIVIGTDGASFEELIEDGVCGFLVERNNPDELASVLTKVWTMDQSQLSEIGENARKKIEALNPQHTVRILEQYYEEHKATI